MKQETCNTTTQDFINGIIQNKGPEISDYTALDDICINRPEQLELFNKSELNFLNSTESIMGHILLKPYGYAGDFEIIDRIYQNNTSTTFQKWDAYSLSNAAAQAVRNRKDYFKRILHKKLQQQQSINVLNIASGPARDLFEFFEESEKLDSKINFTCIDMDLNAINYAQKLNAPYLDQIKFIHQNIFRFTTDKKFDLIWSAGLFDYFKDKTFVSVLSRMYNWMTDNGEIIIGNFNEDHNPSRNYMEIIGEWFLHHRNETQLDALAGYAGFRNIKIGKEDKHINLFLHLKKNSETILPKMDVLSHNVL